MKILVFALFILLNISLQAQLESDMDFVKLDAEKTSSPREEIKKEDFSYFCIGITRSSREYEPTIEWGPDVFIGRRHFTGDRQAINYGIGSYYFEPLHFFLLYIQSSFLYYPEFLDGLYLGPGLTLGLGYANPRRLKLNSRMCSGHIVPCLNIPLTLGYEFGGTDHRSYFIQLQATLIETVNLSYGFRF